MSALSQQNNKRIAKNTLLLYFRMLFSMGIGLFTSRIVLESLGIEDYGIYNLVGGIVTIFAFLNSAMIATSQRFISYELGKGNLHKLKDVFCTTLTIHIAIAFIIVVLSEVIGVWFLNTKLNIPSDRMMAANWTLQLSIFVFAVNVISVPYNASIVAHEKMSAFAYISIFVYCNCNIYKDKKHIYPRKDVEEEVIFRGREAVDDFLLDMIAPLPEYHHDVRYMMSVGHAIYRHSIFMEHRVQFVSEREFVSEDIIFDIDFLSHVRSVCYLPDCLHYYVVNPYSLSHTYDDAKYHKMVNLSRIIKERLAKIYSEEKYYLHYLRSVFFLLRNTVMRMVLAGETDQKIKRILEEKLYQELLSNYPYQRMDN